MSSIVSLNGKPLYTPESNAALIHCLEEWLERARSGEVVGVAIACLYRDGASSWEHSGAQSISLVGELFSFAQRLTRDMDDA